jgi:hypothetical protein
MMSSMREPVSTSTVPDGERAALLDLAGGPEERAGHLESAAVDAPRHGAPARAQLVVVGTGHAGQRVEEHEHVALLEHHALGLVEDLLGHLYVPAVRIVIARGDDLRRLADGHAEVRHFLGALVHEEDDDRHLGVILEHRLGDLLEQDGLARARRGHDEPALAAADGRDEIHGAHGQLVGGGLEPEPLMRLHRGEALEPRGRGRRRRQPRGPSAMLLARSSRWSTLRRSPARAAPVSGSSTQRGCS